MSVAAQSERASARSRSGSLTPALAWLLALALLLATAEIVLDGALGHSALIPKSPPIAGWLTNPFGAPLWTLGGTYRFELARTDGGWEIHTVVQNPTWAEGNKDILALAAKKAAAAVAV